MGSRLKMPIIAGSRPLRTVVRRDVDSVHNLSIYAPCQRNATFSTVQVCPVVSGDYASPSTDCGSEPSHSMPIVRLDYSAIPAMQENRAARSRLDRLRTKVSGTVRTWWMSYQRALDQEPVQTKALTSCTGLFLADVIAQAAEPGAYDPMRTARMAAFGLLWHGISGHYWYQILDRVVMPKRPTATATIVTKMLADQLLWSPINVCIFYASLAMMEGNVANISSILDEKLLPTVLAGYALWPLAHLINFKFIPSHNRLLYINVVNLFWSIYLAKVANSGHMIMPNSVPSPNFAVPAIPVSNPAQPPPPMSFPTA